MPTAGRLAGSKCSNNVTPASVSVVAMGGGV